MTSWACAYGKPQATSSSGSQPGKASLFLAGGQGPWTTASQPISVPSSSPSSARAHAAPQAARQILPGPALRAARTAVAKEGGKRGPGRTFTNVYRLLKGFAAEVKESES